MNKKIKFSEYFHKWLYTDNGYYSNYKTIGKEGDFYTAVSSSRFFGGSIGKKVVDIIEEGFLPSDTTIVEVGAHHGYLIADMVQFIYTLKPELISTLKFAIVERYEHLRIKQKEYFHKCFGDEIELVHYNDISEVKLQSAFVVANEIFDAFPCELVYTNEKNTLQYAIVEDDDIKFIDSDEQSLNTHCSLYNITKGEVAVGYEEFASQMCKNIDKFEFVTFDYGEKYPRNDFSCRVYEKHNVYPIFDEEIKLDQLFGKSDITYDVNFSHVIDSFKKAGAINITYETQLKALVSFGIIELLEILHKNVDEKTYLSEANKVKTLLNPTGMGDRFKMANFRYEKNKGEE
ncbi:MAG: SAM-dependent methyltransferase [Campylobacterota bacterium]|nr:SAM-dependent methyltransferase [Campylobacterota bacterium]